MAVKEIFAQMRVKDTAAAIAFYEAAFGGRELFRLTEPSGRIGHAEVSLDGHVIMLSDEFPELGYSAPNSDAVGAISIHLHVDDCDAMIARAIEAGATLVRPPTDAFYGERSGVVRDPFGHHWNLGHQIEAVDPVEMQRRYIGLFDAK